MATGHYHRTQFARNAAGLVNRTRNAAGTIYRTVWDGRGNAISQWVGTDDTSATDLDPTGVSAAGNDMVKVSEAEYDESCGCPSSSGDGNITKLTLYPGGGGGSGAAERVTEYHYDWRARLVAVRTDVEGSEGTDVQRQISYVDLNNLGQVTATYLYDGDNVTITERYPDASAGTAGTAVTDTVTYIYNALGEVKSYADKNGNVHEYTYDVLGRFLTDAVTTLGSGVNGAVRRLATTYNTQGLPEKFTSYNAATSGSVVNEVQRAYNGLGQIVTEYQAHGGAVNTGSSPKVEYAYTEMASGANHSRLKSMTYPNGRILRYEYSGLDADISRVSFLADDSSGSVGTHLEEYSYLGAGTIVRRNRPEPGVELTYIRQGAEGNGEAGDQYAGLDRFGRIVDQRWHVTGTSGATHTDRFQYSYDRNSNPLYKDNKLQSSMSELYHANSGSSGDNNTAYDKLNRLTDFRRGTLSSSGNNGPGLDTVSSASRTQGWSLDALGNSTSVSTNGTPQSRTHNSKNQSTVVGGNNLVFDDAGNTTTDESGKQHVYDAWNRLVESKASAGAGGASLVTHAYDALGRRVKESPNAGTATDFYYTASWQIAEEQQSGTTKAQNVWGLSYIDDLVLRDKDADGSSGTGSLGKASSGLEQRLYAQQDANHNVTALVNTSGTVLQRFVYDPYGVSTVLAANWSGTTDGYQWHERHQGTRWEPIADLYVIRNRFYSPNRMAWMSEDKKGYVDGASLYAFNGQNPTARVDPFGLFWSWAGAGVGAAFGAVAGAAWSAGAQTYSYFSGTGFNANAVLNGAVAGATGGAILGGILGASTGDPTALLLAGSVGKTMCQAGGASFIGGWFEALFNSVKAAPVPENASARETVRDQHSDDSCPLPEPEKSTPSTPEKPAPTSAPPQSQPAPPVPAAPPPSAGLKWRPIRVNWGWGETNGTQVRVGGYYLSLYETDSNGTVWGI